jgi:AraC family transcriptional activator of pobA
MINAQSLPVHALEAGSQHINILPLDYSNPYDYKREHRHTYYEIMLIERGGGNQLIDFKNYVAHDHSCYIICPQQIHLMNRNKSTGIILQFTEERIQSAELLSHLRQLTFADDAAIIFENNKAAFEELTTLLRIIETQVKNDASLNLHAAVHLVQGFISIMLASRQNKEGDKREADKQLLIAFYQLLELHYKANRGVQYFIEMLGSTEKKLGAATKKFTGLSPLQVIHNRILLEAKRLLLFERGSHKEIAYDLGFDSPASFSAFIKLKTGHAPSELAKQLTEIHK